MSAKALRVSIPQQLVSAQCVQCVRGASVSSVSEVEALLDERVTGFEVRRGSTVIGLCREHYNKLYRLSSAVPKCAFCGTEQRGNTLINKRCPEPDKINTYLQQTN